MLSGLMDVQASLKAPKGQYNSFGGYSYRSCEDILEAVKPLLAEKGLLLTLTDELLMVGDRFYVKATAAVTDGKETATAHGYAREAETKKGSDVAQITGMASSYARKYALSALLLIDDGKDADSAPVRGNQAPKPSRLKQACDRLQSACAAYEKSHGNGAEAGWAMEGVKSRPDFPAKDAPADKRAEWFERVAGEFEAELG